ncbi:MAG TPA: 16S rRNA (guanine(527)-N(7))-methyltransferase RsmG [Ideonella sp.]|uniref:16S rRNA (guanine(527)-N(7))-methyltransferase RsmG n=1 Tax=Ideonella sp. TaxID=1929293 RepID=UPI002E325DDD|nr:16S rRNA (guanine(527)-N(7))-methyltransferase RsmG [Ideonella sp.]HEX5686930.1 16S rRNA (guanine(527)-N(7))-methyltransferase RsmG [Ideonella sp.]
MTTAFPHPLAAALQQGLGALRLPVSPDTEARLLRYLDLIAHWNRVYNLTAIREPQAMLTQHLLDCLAIVGPLSRELGEASPRRILDVGSGAGLPGAVLAICRPDWQVTCVDAVAKKATFIRQVAAELQLPNLTASHQRVEAMEGPGFDLITSRAFATLADFVNLTRQRLAPEGCWVAMKAHLTDAERLAVPAGVSVFHVEQLTVPGLDAARCLVWMRPDVG